MEVENQMVIERPMIIGRTITSHVYDVFLDEDIEEPSRYRDLISILFNADENDTVNIFFNTNGGQIDSAISIIEALKATAAETNAILVGACHSAGTIIMMYCKNIYVQDAAYCLIHTASGGYMGTVGNNQSYASFNNTRITKIMEEAYKWFLTTEEFEKLKLGMDLWFDADEVRARLLAKAELMAEEEKEEEQMELPLE